MTDWGEELKKYMDERAKETYIQEPDLLDKILFPEWKGIDDEQAED